MTARIRQMQEQRFAAQRRSELRVLEAADALDPADTSLPAQQIREAAAAIVDSPDPAEHDRRVWGVP